MRLDTSYRQIISISLPIMLGSAVQNIIALTDSVFLYHLSSTDFAAIGFVGVFYLIIAAIGYSFSKGGQIMIARRQGEGRLKETGTSFHALMFFELFLALIMFFFMQYGAEPFFRSIVNSESIIEKSMEYLIPRSYGVFFSYLGVGIIALYTGIGRTKFIVIDTLLLALINILLNYGLIYGHWGLPALGIAGAGWASTIAEVIAFFCFVLYMIFDRKLRYNSIFSFPKVKLRLIRQVFHLSSAVVVQSVVGLGSWFAFFSIIEKLGERELAISNLARIVYLILSVPTWGYASGINTMVSHFIGRSKRQAVMPIIWKTAKLALATTMIFAIPIVLLPEYLLYPILGGEDMSLIYESRQVLYMLLVILALFAVGGIYFNGFIGTGATWAGLRIQLLGTAVYIVYVYFAVIKWQVNLVWAWGGEVVYWVISLGATLWFLHQRNWHELKF